MRSIPLLALCLSLCAIANAQPPAPVISPDIAADRTVTFRLAAPMADKVEIASGGDIPQIPQRTPLPMNRTADGVWELALQLDPGAYRYNFVVDGVRVLDPGTPMVSESNDNAWSWLHVAGTEWMDTNNVPHGAVSEVTYPSSVVGSPRRLHVYTPPGYETNNGMRYPVLYLLHGAFDSDDSWTTVGRAGFILDNLIASGAAKPMIVVMPRGHTGPFRSTAALNMADFVSEFRTDIKPFIEGRYPLAGGRNNTAIAGLSMGGAQTLDIAFGNLTDYGYVGVYSSGVFGIADGNQWEQQHVAALDDAGLKQGLKLVWFSTGSDDFLLDTTRKTVAMLQQHKFGVDYTESTGGHTWINWRDYLHTFVPQLFR